MEHFPLVALSLFLTRLLILGASFGEALIALGLIGLYSGHKYLEFKKEKPINESVKAEIQVLKSQILELQQNQAAIKLGNQLKR